MNHASERLESMTPLQKAVLALKQTQARIEAIESRAREPIALLGMGCRLPGGVDSPASFWRLLCEGRDAITPVSPRRWPRAITDLLVGEQTIDIGQGGFLDDIANFDHRFFSMTERESAETDPQQRILLEVTWEALEDAGLVPGRLRGGNCGVFLGIAASEYGINLACHPERVGPWIGPGTALCIAANRISYQFNWRGPSLVLDTACSSSLMALHLACRSLRDGECDLAIVGGTSLLLTPFGSQNLARAGFFSPTGRIRAFDENADGYVRSDAIAVVVLQRAADVRLATYRPYGLILGTAINQDGSSNGLTAPSRKGQEDLLRAACQSARIKPAEVEYVEAHGTGTPIGDSLEATALSAVYGEDRPADAPLKIGSVKTNIGHTEAASGVVSLIKVALAMEHGALPPTLHFRRPNPNISFADLKLQVQTQLGGWPQVNRPPLAGISAFGFGGTNAHVLLQGLGERGMDPLLTDTQSPGILLLSARSEPALKELALRFIPLLSEPSHSWRDLCYSAAVHRQHHEWRLAIKADDPLNAADRLREFSNGDQDPRFAYKCCNPDHPPRLAFVFKGDGDATGSLRRFIAAAGEIFAEPLTEIEARVQGISDKFAAIGTGGLAPEVQTRLQLLANYHAVATGWRRLGLRPQSAGGAGVGAVAAAVEAGVIDLGSALDILASGADEWNLAPGAKPELTLVLRGKVWGGRSALRISFTAPDPMADECLAALTGNTPGTIFDIDQLRLVPDTGNDRPQSRLPDQEEAFTRLLTDFHILGFPIDWSTVLRGRFTRLPTYPWQRQPFWVVGGVPGDVPIPSSSERDQRVPEVTRSENALFKPEIRPRPDLYTPYAEAATPLEKAISQAWSDVLGITPVGRHDHFLELGGDSLRAMMLLNRMQQAIRQTVVPALILKAQTVAEQAESLRLEYPNEVLRIFPDEPGVEWVENRPTADSSTVDQALFKGIRNLIESNIEAEITPATAVKNPPICFVLSPPRSGSTLFRVMLAGHAGLFVPPELDLLTIDTLAQWEKYGEVRNSWRNGLVEALRNALGWSLEQARDELGQWIQENRRSQELYGLLQHGIGDRLLVDKTPGYSISLTILRKAEQWFQNARYVHLVRHPCDTILSYKEYKLHLGIERTHPLVAGLSPAQLGELSWLLSHDNILRFLADIPTERSYRIHFESLVAQPRQEMERVASFLGLPFSEEMIHPYRNQDAKMLGGADGSGLSQGDQKFQLHHKMIDVSVAGRWKTQAPEMILGDPAWDLALRLGYQDLPPPAKYGGDDDDTLEGHRAAELLDRLDELSDSEVEDLLNRELGLAEKTHAS